jgi:hypothetical protein
MSFAQMLQDAIKDYPEVSPSKIETPPSLPACKMCRDIEPLNGMGYCGDCQKTVDRQYQISQLAGRCANGAERDRGIRFHARRLDKDCSTSWIALCGYSPGRMSAGWSDCKPLDRLVTCPRCKQRLSRNGNKSK